MNKKQASNRWEVSEYQVRKICKHMNLDTSVMLNLKLV